MFPVYFYRTDIAILCLTSVLSFSVRGLLLSKRRVRTVYSLWC